MKWVPGLPHASLTVRIYAAEDRHYFIFIDFQ